MLRRIALLLALSLSASELAMSQTASVPTKDSNAVALLAGSLNAMLGSATISDVTLSAQVTRTAGAGADSGAVTLQAVSSGNASITYSFSNGQQRAEIINPSSPSRGAWSGADGAWHQMAVHNTWTPAPWFAPALVLELALNDPQAALDNLGTTTLNGITVAHIRLSRVLPPSSGSATTLANIQSLTAVDVYLDEVSNLPISLSFNLHPDSNAGADIPVVVQYSNWAKASGILLPFHVQRFLNGSPLEDISVSSATVNSGLSPSVFNVPMAGGSQ